MFSRSASTFMTKLSFLRLFFISLRFTGSSGGGTGVTGRFGDFTVSRFFTNTFSCVSVRFSPRLVLDVPGVVVVVSGSGSISPCMSWSSSSGLSGRFSSLLSSSFFSSFSLSCSCTSGTGGRTQLSHLLLSTLASVESRRLIEGSLLTSCPRTRCSFVRSLLPSHTADFHLSASFGAEFPDSFPTCEHGFAKFQQLPIARGLCIVAPETRNEPSCMLDNPCHQSTISSRSVLCAFLHCCQHCAHLSLQLFLIIFNSSFALM